MNYFQQFPKSYYSLVPGQAPVIIVDITARVKLQHVNKKNQFLYYPYNIKDTDTCEVIATKYYSDPARFWIVLAANDIINPWFDWPLPYDVFQSYIANKYGSVAYAQETVHHYEEWIARTDSATGTTTTTVLQVNTPPSVSGYNVAMKDGTTVSVTINPNTVYLWDYEYALNEAKRTINIIDKQYVGQIEAELIAAFQ